MASVNKTTTLGNLGQDPKVTESNGKTITKISVATSYKYKNQAGEQVEETEWNNITFFGKLAEIAAQYLKKGSSVYVEGRLKTSKWTDANGHEKYQTSIIGDSMQMLGGKPEGATQSAKPIATAPSLDDIPF